MTIFQRATDSQVRKLHPQTAIVQLMGKCVPYQFWGSEDLAAPNI